MVKIPGGLPNWILAALDEPVVCVVVVVIVLVAYPARLELGNDEE
jgi:hypothetical protein